MQLFNRRSENWGSVALLCLPTAIAVALIYECTSRLVWPIALIVVCIPAVYELGRRLKVRRLRRMVAASNAITWAVFVNDVLVAKIQDTQYAEVQLKALLAPGNYIAQASNLLRVALATIGRVAILTPLIFVWALAIGAIVSPQDTAYVLAHASTLTTKDVESFGQLWTTISLLALVFASAVFPFFGMDIGYVDHFERDIQARVRRLVGTPADGVIRLTPDQITQTALPTPQRAG